jgi:hypothetical protein
VRRQPAQQRPEGLPVRLAVQPGEHVVLGRGQPAAEVDEQLAAARGRRDPPGPGGYSGSPSRPAPEEAAPRLTAVPFNS